MNGETSSSDAERFVMLLAENERLIRQFIFSFLSNRDHVDEVMQEVCVVLWKKFDELEDDDRFLQWAFVIARYEVLMFRRKLARDRHVFKEELIELLASENTPGDLDAIKSRNSALEVCFSNLLESERKLLLMAYSSNMKIKGIAAALDRTANSVYQNLARLRQRLHTCVESRLNRTLNR